MTTEEKAKAYDEAIERAKRIKNGEDNWRYSDLSEIIPALEDVLPELKESEDERIRKFLIDILSHGTWRKEWPFGPNEVVAYLEKQKEQFKEEKVPEQCLKCNEYEIGYKAGYTHGCTAGYNKAMKEVEQKEQKPYEPSDDELERHQKELYDFKVFAAKQAKEHHISFVHDFEWNNFCAELLSYFHEPKPAWSEEDELTIADLINYFEGDSLECSAEEMVQRIKSLSPQSHWKPSEEQMYSLGTVVKGYDECTVGSVGHNLKSLYEDLKKL